MRTFPNVKFEIHENNDLRETRFRNICTYHKTMDGWMDRLFGKKILRSSVCARVCAQQITVTRIHDERIIPFRDVSFVVRIVSGMNYFENNISNVREKRESN